MSTVSTLRFHSISSLARLDRKHFLRSSTTEEQLTVQQGLGVVAVGMDSGRVEMYPNPAKRA